MNMTTKNRACVFTVVYPGCIKFWGDFIASVESQDYQPFDLVLLNDGVTDVHRQLPNGNINMIVIPASGSIAEIREQGIRWLIDSRYDTIIFADADDYFSKNRVRTSIEMIQQADIYVNDISMVSSEGLLLEDKYFSNRLNNGIYPDIEFLVNRNIMGLGNTAVRREALRGIEIPKDTVAVDWLLFTDLLLNDRAAVFSNDAVTFYRQHEANTIGLGKPDEKRIMKSIEVQSRHSAYFAPESELHKAHLDHILELKQYLTGNRENFNLYVEQVQKNITPFPFWWEEVKTLEELGYEHPVNAK